MINGSFIAKLNYGYQKYEYIRYIEGEYETNFQYWLFYITNTI